MAFLVRAVEKPMLCACTRQTVRAARAHMKMMKIEKESCAGVMAMAAPSQECPLALELRLAESLS